MATSGKKKKKRFRVPVNNSAQLWSTTKIKSSLEYVMANHRNPLKRLSLLPVINRSLKTLAQTNVCAIKFPKKQLLTEVIGSWSN